MSLEEFRRSLKSERMVIGTRRALKLLREGRASSVYLSANCPASVRDDVKRYAKGVSVEELDVPNDELGVICKRPFSVSVVALPR